MRPLVLFDIDATLLKTDGAGVAAMGDAGRELFGSGFTTAGIDFAGRLDVLLFRELFVRNGVEPTPAAAAQLRRTYVDHLRLRLSASTTARALPGAAELVDALRGSGSHELGILTGNFQESGSMKLTRCGLDPSWFPIGAWGDDSPHDPPDRAHLPPVAMRRYRERFGWEVDPSHVTIIGDTPHDVRCARVNGCRCIAVATGAFGAPELATIGADWVVQDLRDTAHLLGILSAPPDSHADTNRQTALPV